MLLRVLPKQYVMGTLKIMSTDLMHKNGQNLNEALLTGRISNACSVPLFSVSVSESTGATGASAEAAVRTDSNKMVGKASLVSGTAVMAISYWVICMQAYKKSSGFIWDSRS